MIVNVANWRKLSARDKQHLIEFAIQTNNIRLLLAKKYK